MIRYDVVKPWSLILDRIQKYKLQQYADHFNPFESNISQIKQFQNNADLSPAIK